MISGDEGMCVCVGGHPDFGEEGTDSTSLWFPWSHLSQAAVECLTWIFATQFPYAPGEEGPDGS